MNVFSSGRRAESDVDSLSRETREFAEAVLGKPMWTDRERLEWLAQISPTHEAQLQALIAAEAAQARREALAATDEADLFARAVRGDGCGEQYRRHDTDGERSFSPSQIGEANWDPAKHPRRGGAPNAGWFASSGGGTISPHGLGPSTGSPGATGLPTAIRVASTGLASGGSGGSAPGAPIIPTAASSNHRLLAAAVPKSVKIAARWGDKMEQVLKQFGIKTIDDVESAPNKEGVERALGNALAQCIKNVIDSEGVSNKTLASIDEFLKGTPSAIKVLDPTGHLHGAATRVRKTGNRYSIVIRPDANLGIKHGQFEGGVGFKVTITW